MNRRREKWLFRHFDIIIPVRREMKRPAKASAPRVQFQARRMRMNSHGSLGREQSRNRNDIASVLDLPQLGQCLVAYRRARDRDESLLPSARSLSLPCSGEYPIRFVRVLCAVA